MFITHYVKDGQAIVFGIEQPPATVIRAAGSILVLKVPGFKYAYSAHPTRHGYGYSRAEFQVYRILEVKEDTAESYPLLSTASSDGIDLLKVEEITRFPVKGKG